ncbi:pistil-specific extensin-like protein [Andrographis paniculata]|uniref:pistil-specific extensin-like protein n=1 Tax=Andrographis paniculata TaxID=175694 RepID=UPI0021E71081|nr:pistil-specific extensin-like protein [Andrographis paniculata]
MGPNILLLALAASLLVSSTAAGYGADDLDPQVFHVTGKVLCQDCNKGWNEWVNGADPIKDSRVSVTCLDDRKRVVHYASDLTDKNGDFDIACNRFVNGKELKPQNCNVRLVSSPDPVCNIATDFAGGKTGLKLRRPTEVYRDVLKFALGPLYYTTPMCDDPDTSGPEKTY